MLNDDDGAHGAEDEKTDNHEDDDGDDDGDEVEK